MQFRPLFATPLLSFSVTEDGSVLAELRERILAREAGDAGARRTSRGGWQSGSDFPAWCGAAGSAILAALREAALRHTVSRDGDELHPGAGEWRLEAWANINRRGASNDAHCHSEAFWSACFYVDDGGIAGRPELGGAIEFLDPRGARMPRHGGDLRIRIGGCASAGRGERIFPRTGHALLFPGWLAHRVEEYRGKGTRICIAANFQLAGVSL